MNQRTLSPRILLSLFLIVTCGQSFPADVQPGNKRSWLAPVSALGLTSLIIGKSIYNSIGSKWGGRMTKKDLDARYRLEIIQPTKQKLTQDINAIHQTRNLQLNNTAIYSITNKQTRYYKRLQVKDCYTTLAYPLVTDQPVDMNTNAPALYHPDQTIDLDAVIHDNRTAFDEKHQQFNSTYQSEISRLKTEKLPLFWNLRARFGAWISMR